MSILIINYELKTPFKDYAPFYAAIKSNATEWWHFMDNTWLVATSYSADQFAKLLYPHIVNTDHLLVMKVQKEYQGWLPKEAWDWLNSKYFF